jgi:hypothetical protein
MLKFGQVIDVTMLDTLGLRNKGADELREALKSQVRVAAPGCCVGEWDSVLKVLDLCQAHQGYVNVGGGATWWMPDWQWVGIGAVMLVKPFKQRMVVVQPVEDRFPPLPLAGRHCRC